MKKIKTETMWILHQEATGFISMVHFQKSGLIRDTIYNYNESWASLKERGYSVIKVSVAPWKEKIKR